MHLLEGTKRGSGFCPLPPVVYANRVAVALSPGSPRWAYPISSPYDKTIGGSQVSPTTPKMGTKKAKVSLINRTPLPVTVLSDYREKGKTYRNQPRLFLTC